MYGRKEVESYEMTHHKKAEELRCYGVTQVHRGKEIDSTNLGFPTRRDCCEFRFRHADIARHAGLCGYPPGGQRSMLRDASENFKFQKSKRLFKDLRFCFSAGGIRLVHLVLVFCRGELQKKKDLRPGRYINILYMRLYAAYKLYNIYAHGARRQSTGTCL